MKTSLRNVAVCPCFTGSLVLCAGIFCAEPLQAEMEKGRLDGVKINAVENYQNFDTNRVAFGIGVYPLDAYYNGFSLNLSYLHYYNTTIGWEIINANYVYAVATNITSELANKFSVNPQFIEKLRYTVSSNYAYVISYGKLLNFETYIRYFRVIGLLGAGVVATSTQNSPSVNAGIRFEVNISPFLSWDLEARDQYAVTERKHYVGFNLGFGTKF